MDQGHGRFREIKAGAVGGWSSGIDTSTDHGPYRYASCVEENIGWRSSRPAETHPFMESGDRDRAESLSKCSGSLALIGVSNLRCRGSMGATLSSSTVIL